MITYIVHLRVKPNRTRDFEALMSEVAARVHETEPDVLYYEFAISAADAATYVVIEVYRSREANAAHLALPWIIESLKKSGKMIEGVPDIRQYISPGTDPIPGRGGAPE
jgi:quinol monooxygenase YgiN